MISNQIKLHRVQCGDLTQQDLAEKVGCSRQTIHSIEKGKFNPSVELALKLAHALETTVDALFQLTKAPATNTGENP